MDVPVRGRRLPSAVLTLVVGGLFASCSPGPIAVPEGAQEIHIVVSGDSVSLTPLTVRAGDIYIVLDVPGSSVNVVEPSTATAESPDPFTADALDRIRHGDTFLTSMGGIADSERYGNVRKLVLAPGRYAFLADAPEALAERWGGTIPPEAMAVLTVLP